MNPFKNRIYLNHDFHSPSILGGVYLPLFLETPISMMGSLQMGLWNPKHHWVGCHPLSESLNLIPTKTVCSPKIQPKNTTALTTTLIERIWRFFEKVFNCSATLWQEARSPRSFCTTVENNPFPANPVTPGSSQTSKQNSSCHASGVILWFCDTNPNMALLGGNP